MGLKINFKYGIILVLFILSSFQLTNISNASTIVITDIDNPVFIDATEPSYSGTTYSIIDGENNIHVISSYEYSSQNFIINKNDYFTSDTNFTRAYAVQIEFNRYIVYVVELGDFSGTQQYTNSHILTIQDKIVENRLNIKVEFLGLNGGLFFFQDNVYLVYQNNSAVEISKYNPESNKLEKEFNSNEFINYNTDGNSTFEGISIYEDFLLVGINYWHSFNSTAAYYIMRLNPQFTLEIENYNLIDGQIIDVSIFQDSFIILTRETLFIGDTFFGINFNLDINADYQSEIIQVEFDKLILKTENRLEYLEFVENDYINVIMSTELLLDSYYNNLVSDIYLDTNNTMYIAYLDNDGEIVLYSNDKHNFIENIPDGLISYISTTETSGFNFSIELPLFLGTAILLLGIFVFVKKSKKEIGPKYKNINEDNIYDEQLSKIEIGLKSCGFCGFKNEYQDIFCSNCGKKIK